MFPPMASDVGTHILGENIKQTKIKAMLTSVLYQMACNLSMGAWIGSVRIVMKSWIVRKPWASPGSSPEYL